MLPPFTALDATTSPLGSLLVLSIVVPIVGALLAFVLGVRYARLVAFVVIPIASAIAVGILVALPQRSGPIVYLLGAWSPPLGIALRADGLSAMMMAATAAVICAVAVFAAADFSPAATGTRAPFTFWILLLAIWGALSTIFLGGDLFTLYVALELLTFSAVPLVSLEGRAETLRAAIRYLLFALFGSVLYLLGTALFYGLYGTLDIVLLSRRISAEPTALAAAALMTTGLLAKTALFPLHLWLPSAHAGAPSAASAILSGLVVKGSFFIIVRLWFNVMPGLPGFAATQLLAALGGAAIVFGSVVALRQERLKLLIAYSTLAQIGYLFLMFPLAIDTSGKLVSGGALAGGLLQAVSHATAKAAMFMAAGSIYAALGQDRLSRLGGIGRTVPISVLTFALSGLALMGFPPSGAYLAKELLLQAATEQGQWWWTVVLQTGGVLTGAYILLVLTYAMAPTNKQHPMVKVPPRIGDVAALSLALCSLLLGLAPWGAYLSTVPRGAMDTFGGIAALAKAFLPLLGGALLAILLGRWEPPLGHPSRRNALLAAVAPVRRPVLASSALLEGCDNVLRQWPAACICLLSLVALFAASMRVAF
jgi:formate hydrogenlyase subunit 3/multisubunit Na+/H+ antiporter MnhD subunit